MVCEYFTKTKAGISRFEVVILLYSLYYGIIRQNIENILLKLRMYSDETLPWIEHAC